MNAEGGMQKAEFSVADCHPVKQLVTLTAARGWSAGDFLIQRKYDGELAVRQYGHAVLLGELVKARSGAFLTATDRALIEKYGSFFAAFTVAEVAGQDFLAASTKTRNALLRGLSSGFDGDLILAEVVTDPAAAMAAGAEGVCAHGWGDAWGSMLCHKAAEIHLCRVRQAAGGQQSVEIEDAATGEPRGRVALRGGKCDRVRVGSLIRVEAMGMTVAGKLRQPNPCREWLMEV